MQQAYSQTIVSFLPYFWQGQSEIILKINKNNFFSRKGHCTICLQSGSNCLVTQVSDTYCQNEKSQNNI